MKTTRQNLAECQMGDECFKENFVVTEVLIVGNDQCKYYSTKHGGRLLIGRTDSSGSDFLSYTAFLKFFKKVTCSERMESEDYERQLRTLEDKKERNYLSVSGKVAVGRAMHMNAKRYDLSLRYNSFTFSEKNLNDIV